MTLISLSHNSRSTSCASLPHHLLADADSVVAAAALTNSSLPWNSSALSAAAQLLCQIAVNKHNLLWRHHWALTAVTDSQRLWVECQSFTDSSGCSTSINTISTLPICCDSEHCEFSHANETLPVWQSAVEQTTLISSFHFSGSIYLLQSLSASCLARTFLDTDADPSHSPLSFTVLIFLLGLSFCPSLFLSLPSRRCVSWISLGYTSISFCFFQAPFLTLIIKLL